MDITSEAILDSHRPLTIKAEGSSIIVSVREPDSGGQPVQFTIEPAPIAEVIDEPLMLSEQAPDGWANGTRLMGIFTGGINAMGSFIPESLVLHRTPGGDELIKDVDYLVSAEFGMLGIGPGSVVTPADTVYAGYRYAQMRIDTLMVGPDDQLMLLQGTPHLTLPLPPGPPAGYRPYANIFRPYGAREVREDDIFLIEESAEYCPTATTGGRIPRTLAKLQAGQPVTIVCWGDSVTNGGDASCPENRYVDVFAAGLRQRFPQAQIDVNNISVDGSSSMQWLYPDDYPPVSWQHGIDFSRVVNARPDLITLEFVNDCWLTHEQIAGIYGEILRRFTELSAECILITPHFTHPKWMGFTSMREAEKRPYVLALREFAGQQHLALADAAARWEHLWKEGIPYVTLLNNSVNHPDDRGHRLFAEELWKCFE